MDTENQDEFQGEEFEQEQEQEGLIDASQEGLIRVTGMYKDWFLDYASYVIL